MKNFLSIFLAIVMVCSLVACGNQPGDVPPPKDDTAVTQPDTTPSTEPTTAPEATEPIEPEVEKLSTVSEIMALAIDNLVNEEYITLHLDAPDEDNVIVNFHTTTGEVYSSSTISSIGYKDEYYIVRDGDGYISYKVENAIDDQGNIVETEAVQYMGRQDLDIDFTFLNCIEVYLQLNPETEIIDGVECYVLNMHDNIEDSYSGEEFTVYIDVNTGRFVQIIVNDDGDIGYLYFTYEPFKITVSDAVKTNAIIKERQYTNEYSRLFSKSTYDSEDKEIYNIVIDDIETIVGKKADFLNNQNKNFTVDENGAYFLDGLVVSDEVEIKDNMVEPKVMVMYNLEYKTEDNVYRWTVTTRNNTDEAIKENECTIIAIMQSGKTPIKEMLSLVDIKAIYGNNYERFGCPIEEVVLTWPEEEYTVIAFIDGTEISMFSVMHNSMYDVVKSVFLTPIEIITEELKPSTIQSAAEFIVDGKTYKLYDATNADFAPYLSEPEELEILTKSKVYTSIYGTLTAPIGIMAVGPNPESMICGYGVFAIEESNNNFKMSNGLTLNHSYKDFLLVLGQPSSASEQEDAITVSWTTNKNMFRVDVVFEIDNGEVGKVKEITVMDFTAYALDIIMSLVDGFAGDIISNAFDALKPKNS